MINIKIHRGTNQIGGTITEVFTENTHIFIDFGSELCASPEESTDGVMVEMLKHSACDAVLFSHYHGDHVGLFQHIPDRLQAGRHTTVYPFAIIVQPYTAEAGRIYPVQNLCGLAGNGR